VESPEEVVAALAEEVARLTARAVCLTADLDATYERTFGGLTVNVQLTSPTTATSDRSPGSSQPATLETVPRSFPDISEASFRRLGAEDPAAVVALLGGAQEDAAQWLRFQREAGPGRGGPGDKRGRVPHFESPLHSSSSTTLL
jgi:hypothetical protein